MIQYLCSLTKHIHMSHKMGSSYQVTFWLQLSPENSTFLRPVKSSAQQENVSTCCQKQQILRKGRSVSKGKNKAEKENKTWPLI